MMSEFNELDFIWRIGKLLGKKNTSEDFIGLLNSIFSKYLDVKSFNIILHAKTSQNSFTYYGRNDEIDEITSKKYLNIYSALAKNSSFMLNKKLFEFDEDFYLKDKPFLVAIENILYIPIANEASHIGFLEVIFNPTNEKILSEKVLKTLFIISMQINELIINENLHTQITKSADFYKAQKNIAKILETQYDYSFLIPLIGEILDAFVKDYFVYIFMKDDNNKFTLSWPLRYDKSRIDRVLKSIDMKKQAVIEYDGTLVIFPIFFENALKGAVVIDGKSMKISDEDIDYLSRLSVQTATTLDKAGVYAEIEKYATQDALTGLNNRRSLDLRIAQEFAVAKRKNLPLCVMMLDVDYFKAINDTYGHYVGDIILKEFASIIKDEIREYDFAARYGGEEFFIILPSTQIEEAQVVATRLKERIAAKNFDISQFNDKINGISITSSVGLASLTNDMDLKMLYQKVDGALYEAKRTGRNKVVIA